MAKRTSQWYKDLAVYQIWPRSFCDGNGDGIGDLEGVLSKLDYIKSLGVDAIWFSPLYPSPNADYGYDIADYTDISKDYGSLELFKKVLDEAHKRGLKIIMDLVINHTSDQHKWFQESKKGPDNPYHDYYFWRKGRKGGKKPPNNWLSTFQGGAWEYVPEIDEYYLHVFAKGQPDLNMDNPKVREEVKKVIRFWLDLGVDGFREDVITFISKKEGLPNGFPLPTATGIEHYSNGIPRGIPRGADGIRLLHGRRSADDDAEKGAQVHQGRREPGARHDVPLPAHERRQHHDELRAHAVPPGLSEEGL